MAAINEAWGVLGDASRRQRYDRELAEMGRGSYGTSLGSDVGPGPGVAERRMPQPPVVVPTGDLSRFPWKFFTAIGVVAIVVVLIGSLLGDEPPPVEPDNFLVQGDCVTIGAGAGELTEVACSGGHDAKVCGLGGVAGKGDGLGTAGFQGGDGKAAEVAGGTSDGDGHGGSPVVDDREIRRILTKRKYIQIC